MSEPTVDPIEQDKTEDTYLSKLVGEGNKYADHENLAKGYVNLEQHLETIKQEKADLEEKLGLKDQQDDHLKQIMETLKAPKLEEKKEEEPKKEPDPTPEPKKEPETKPQVSMSASLKMQQFAKDSVAKYGDADTVGKHLQEYIGDDKGRQALVQNMMQTDPASLLKILPEPDKEYNPTGSGTTTTSKDAQLPLTWEQALKVREDDPALFNSAKFQKRIMDSRRIAREKNIKF